MTLTLMDVFVLIAIYVGVPIVAMGIVLCMVILCAATADRWEKKEKKNGKTSTRYCPF